jgi:hypothetical protein
MKKYNDSIEGTPPAGPVCRRGIEPDFCVPTSQGAPGRFAPYQRSGIVPRLAGEAAQRRGSASQWCVRVNPPPNPEGWNLKNQRPDNDRLFFSIPPNCKRETALSLGI